VSVVDGSDWEETKKFNVSELYKLASGGSDPKKSRDAAPALPESKTARAE